MRKIKRFQRAVVTERIKFNVSSNEPEKTGCFIQQYNNKNSILEVSRLKVSKNLLKYLFCTEFGKQSIQATLVCLPYAIFQIITCKNLSNYVWCLFLLNLTDNLLAYLAACFVTSFSNFSKPLGEDRGL